ncbi:MULTISPECIES: endolytic transglycosylase MltG [unclassified Streptomyces]|uniref:endolytic transglycosylase MltG n=1 Tax=unclassified Streptomyces TaxID=2593676 RepID=UPI000476213C|nr:MULTISPECIES: endolytic transglycosylase MltG [unclassified Streptomyces]MYY05309.1 endolytic transglycosylase MltG [Streptomyces sp. SID4913]
MTEYGRGPGSEPWHPEDPLYGDQGWGGQQPAHGQGQYDGQDQYGGQQQSYPQGQYDGGQNQYGGQQQPYPQGQYDPYQQQPHDPYAQQQQQDPYAQQQYQQQQAYGNQQEPYNQQDPYNQQQPYDPSWDTGQQAAAMPPYEGQPVATYGYGETNDYYGTPDAYPPPQPPGRREAAPAEAPEPHPDWDPEQQPEETHPFFTGVDEKDGKGAKDDDYDDEDDDPRESRRGDGGERRGKGKKKKGRSGCACLVVSLVLVGGVAGAGYYGYSFYKDRFGAAPDYSGTGSGSVEVEIPKGAYGYDIGNILKKAGVVKSVDAFVSAQNENPKGKSIQAGVYLLHSEMSASEAVKMMVDPKSQNLLVIPEGTRNVAVYAMVDKKLDLKKGTTQGIAKSMKSDLGLPGWASKNKDIKDPLEGFLYPAAYPVTKETKPEAILKKMVSRSNEEYEKLDLEGTAKKYKLDGPWQVLTVASLVQAEGLTHDDFRKMAEVVYNRLKPDNTATNRLLEFDSAFNYLKKQSEITIRTKEIRTNPDPYNTYYHAGLPPGPIGNPGDEALRATLNPTADGWMFFISLDGKKTQFTKTAAEHEKLNKKFKELHGLD